MALEYHEPPQELRAETREVHRGLASLIEELEAMDWYQHRIDVTQDNEMRSILVHNRNEEMEHAAMTLEWLRRRLPDFDTQLRQYLFVEGVIVKVESEDGDEQSQGNEATGAPVAESLGIGNGHRYAAAK